MKILLMWLWMLLLMASCTPTKVLTSSQTTQNHRSEREIDTITKIVTDSTALQLWLECDSLGRVKIRGLTQQNSTLQALVWSLQNNILDLKATSQSEVRVRIKEVHDTLYVKEKVEIPVPGPERIERGALWWWQKWLLWIGVAYLVRTALKIAFNWQKITFKTFFKLL